MFAQARDSQRIYDMSTLSSATGLYLTTVKLASLDVGDGGVGEGVCGTNFWATVAGVTSPFVIVSSNQNTLHAGSRSINGSGWIPIPFSDISGGSPISALPIDPINNTTYFYAYSCNDTSKWFEYDAHMESDKYKNGGSDNVESTDGGDNLNEYEVGNAPGLNL
jgi:hypothetical protein